MASVQLILRSIFIHTAFLVSFTYNNPDIYRLHSSADLCSILVLLNSGTRMKNMYCWTLSPFRIVSLIKAYPSLLFCNHQVKNGWHKFKFFPILINASISVILKFKEPLASSRRKKIDILVVMVYYQSFCWLRKEF